MAASAALTVPYSFVLKLSETACFHQAAPPGTTGRRQQKQATGARGMLHRRYLHAADVLPAC